MLLKPQSHFTVHSYRFRAFEPVSEKMKILPFALVSPNFMVKPQGKRILYGIHCAGDVLHAVRNDPKTTASIVL